MSKWREKKLKLKEVTMNSDKLVLVFLIFSICMFSFGQTSKSEDNRGVLRAGIAKIDITPDNPVMLYGYSSRKTPSEGVLDPLSARAIVFENDNRMCKKRHKKSIILTGDLLILPSF